MKVIGFPSFQGNATLAVSQLPTDLFSILELRNPGIREPYEVGNRRSTDAKALFVFTKVTRFLRR